MRTSLRELKSRVCALACVAAVACGGTRSVFAQSPTMETPPPQAIPGSMQPRIGGAPGAGGNVLGTNPGAGEQILSGRPGASTPRAPIPIGPVVSPRASTLMPTTAPRVQVNVPAFYGPIEVPRTGAPMGPENGLSLDQAIDLLVRNNLDLLSKWYEIPQARADVLTASLRANPIFFWDTQLNPYGNFSQARPGGQPQIDVNITHPIDYSGKRRARIAVAERAVDVLEALFQNEVRLAIDNVYAAYLNVLLARESERYAETSRSNLSRLYEITLKKYKGGFTLPNKPPTSRADVERIRQQLEFASNALDDAVAAVAASKRTLGGLLNLHPLEAERIELRGALLPRIDSFPSGDELETLALEVRPDLAAYRLGVIRAEAEIKLAQANKFQDMYLLFQPYTFQNNTYLGVKSATSYAFGMTVPLPFYNRNQGNIARAKLNLPQSRVDADRLARQVQIDVRQAIAEYETARRLMIRIDREILPASQQALDDTRKLFEGGEIEVSEFLVVLAESVAVGRQRIDAAARVRKALFSLNTAVGRRISP